MKVDKKFVKANYRGKENEKIIIESAKKGEINSYIKHPDTNEVILVPPELVRKMAQGFNVTIEDILKYKNSN